MNKKEKTKKRKKRKLKKMKNEKNEKIVKVPKRSSRFRKGRQGSEDRQGFRKSRSKSRTRSTDNLQLERISRQYPVNKLRTHVSSQP